MLSVNADPTIAELRRRVVALERTLDVAQAALDVAASVRQRELARARIAAELARRRSLPSRAC